MLISLLLCRSSGNHGFKFPNFVCNCCHDLAMLCLFISDIAITTLKDVDYHCIIHDTNKSETIHLLNNSVFHNGGYK